MTDSPRIEELKRRVQSDPASIAFAALAEEYRRAGRFEEAIAACTTGLRQHPSYLSAHVTLGRALVEVGRFEDAREELEYVLKLAPENLAAIRGLAEIHHRTGEAVEEQYAATATAEYQAVREETATTGTEAHPRRAEVTEPVAVSAASFEAERVVPPAIAGLEHFLASIVRARSVSAAVR